MSLSSNRFNNIIYGLCILFLSVACSSCKQNRNTDVPISIISSTSWIKHEAQRIVQTLSISQKSSQILMTGIDGKDIFSPYLKSHFNECVPGAILLFRYNISDTPEKVNYFLNLSSDMLSTLGTDIPVFFAIDHEGGDVYRTGPITTRLPSAQDVSSYLSPDEAFKLYYHSAQQLKYLGIQLNLAPVAELSSTDLIDFLDSRSFSSNPSITLEYSSSVVRAHRSAGTVAVVKHFPGNGSSDPHTSVPVMTGSRESIIETIHQVFYPLLLSNSDAVLVSHTILPAFDPGVPFSLSYSGVNGVLRSQMQFSGLVLTDDISMDAIRKLGYTSSRAAVLALEAGCDMIMTSDTDIQTISKSIQSWAELDQKNAKRLDEAVLNIVMLKLKTGLLKTALETYYSRNKVNAIHPFDSKEFYFEKKQGDLLVEKLNDNRTN